MSNFRTVLLPTDDLAASRALYTELFGAAPVADSDYYVGFEIDGQHIGLVPGAQTVTAYLHVADMERAVALVTDAGGTVVEAPHEVGGGRRVAVVEDASGARFGLAHDAS